ncbi:hypothetical protein TPHSE_25770 [Terrisporobacter petrolearius]
MIGVSKLKEKKDYPLVIYDTPGFELSNEQQNNVKKQNLDIVKVVPVLVQDIDFDDEYIARAYGLDRLIDVYCQMDYRGPCKMCRK